MTYLSANRVAVESFTTWAQIVSAVLFSTGTFTPLSPAVSALGVVTRSIANGCDLGDSLRAECRASAIGARTMAAVSRVLGLPFAGPLDALARVMERLSTGASPSAADVGAIAGFLGFSSPVPPDALGAALAGSSELKSLTSEGGGSMTTTTRGDGQGVSQENLKLAGFTREFFTHVIAHSGAPTLELVTQKWGGPSAHSVPLNVRVTVQKFAQRWRASRALDFRTLADLWAPLVSTRTWWPALRAELQRGTAATVAPPDIRPIPGAQPPVTPPPAADGGGGGGLGGLVAVGILAKFLFF